MSDWAFIATVLSALFAVAGSIYGIRKTSKTEQAKLTQQWATIFGVERQNIALELKEVKLTAEQYAENLRKMKEEFTEAKIAHREALAEKNETIRERDATIRDNLIQLHQVQSALNDNELILRQTRDELISARALIETQTEFIRTRRLIEPRELTSTTTVTETTLEVEGPNND